MLEKDRWQTRAGKLICAAAVLGAAYLILRYMLGAILPFIIAWGIAAPIAVLSAKSGRKFGGKRRAWAVFYIFVFWGTLSVMLALLIGKIGREASEIVAYIVENKEEIGEKMTKAVEKVLEFPQKLPFVSGLGIDGMGEKINGFLSDALQNIAQKGGELLASGIGKVAVATPKFFISVLVCFIASVYIAGDRENIIEYFASLMSEKNRERAKNFFHRVGIGVKGYARAYAWLFVITFFELYIGFSLFGIRYAFILAVVIALFDLLPMFSSAVVLVPWGMVMIIGESYGVGVGMIALSIIMTVVKQVAEPKLVGKGLGIHPLASLAAIYIGFRLFGFVGMLLAPVGVLVIREILQSTKKEEKIKEKT